MADEISNGAEMIDGFEVEDVFEGWDDDSISASTESNEAADLTETEDAEADQPESEEEAALNTEEAAEDNTEADSENTDTTDIQAEFDKAKEEVVNQRFTLNHLGETKDVDRDEVIALAQKGMDYDRIRSERDTLRTEKEALTLHESFLNELAEMSGLSVEDLIIDTKARLVKEDEKKKGYDITLEQAKYRVQSEMAEMKKTIKNSKMPSLVSPETAAAESDNGIDLKARRDASFKRFVSAYPEIAKSGNLPQEVWKEFGDGSGADLVDIYARYENKKLRTEVAELKKAAAAKPKPHSTGSRKSNGSPAIDHDFDGWD